MNNLSFLRRLVCALAGLVLSGPPFIPLAAADEYLNALQAEAEALDKQQQAIEHGEDPSSDWSQEGQGLKSELAQNLSKADFEAELQQNFFGSFMFYSKLNNTERDVVFAEYQRSGKLADVRRKITELLKH